MSSLLRIKELSWGAVIVELTRLADVKLSCRGCKVITSNEESLASNFWRWKGHSVADPDPNPDPDPPDPGVFGLLDPDPDPFVRGMDPDPSIIKQK